MTKVALVAYDPIGSGLSTYTLELAKVLSSFLDVHLLTFEECVKLPRVHIVPIQKPRIPPYFPLLSSLAASQSIEGTVAEIDPDVVHETLPPLSHWFPNLITTKWGYVSYPRLAWIRTTQMNFPNCLGGVPVTFQHWLGDEMSYRNAKYIVNVSANSENYIPPPIEIRQMRSIQPSESLHVLFVARDLRIRRKNLRVLLDASSHLHRSIIIHLVGIGEVKHENVVSHGYLGRESLFHLMSTMDALVLPSIYEEIGYVGLEASSVGVPVIASDIPPFRSMFVDSLMFPPNDSLSLALILNNLKSEDIVKYGLLGRDRALSNNELALARLKQIYTSLPEL